MLDSYLTEFSLSAGTAKLSLFLLESFYQLQVLLIPLVDFNGGFTRIALV